MKTHCKHGHKFTKENTYVRPDGRRTCRTCKREQGRSQEAGRDRKDYMRKYWIKYQYGIDSDQLNVMLEDQDFKCAICRLSLHKPCVDHNHDTGEVRGLLCDSCNQGLGRFKDDPELLALAVSYLSQYQFEK